MNKIKYLRNFESDSIYNSNLFNAYLQSLSPEDTVKVLDLSFEQDYRYRKYILNKILADSEKEFKSFHHSLVEKLMIRFQDLPYKKINSCGHCLSHLYPNYPDSLKKTVLNFFLKNKYVPIRRRAYKILNKNWDEKYESKILDNWEEFKDARCAHLIIKYFDVTFSQKYFKEFENGLDEYWKIRKLYLKIAEHDQSILDYVKEFDQITYCYILVKLAKTISEKEARNIYKNNIDDRRLGLLIWCFGKMKLWDILNEIEAETSFQNKYT